MRLTVLFLASDPNVLTGLASYTFSLVRALSVRSEVTLVTTWSESAVRAHGIDSARIVNIVNSRMPIIAPLVRSWRATKELKKFLPRGSAVVSTIPYGVLGRQFRQVLVVHDMYILQAGYRLDQQLFYRCYMSRLVKDAAKVVCVSEATAADFRGFFRTARDKVCVIKEAGKFRCGLNSYNSDSSYGLFVANLQKNKNVECLLTALKGLDVDKEEIEVRWVGRDPRGLIAAWATSAGGLPQKFKPLGVVSDFELERLYAGARFLVVPSTREGFCLPVLEAQGFGVPVVASDIPVLREVAGGGAIYFDPEEPESLAKSLRQMWSSSTRNDVSAAAFANSALYSWDAVADSFINLLITHVSRGMRVKQ